MLVIQSWNSHNIVNCGHPVLLLDPLRNNCLGDSSSVIKHKVGLASIYKTVVVGSKHIQKCLASLSKANLRYYCAKLTLFKDQPTMEGSNFTAAEKCIHHQMALSTQ